MFVLRSSISVEVSKIFEIINKREDPNKHWGMPGKNQKLTSGGDLYLARKSVYYYNVYFYMATPFNK